MPAPVTPTDPGTVTREGGVNLHNRVSSNNETFTTVTRWSPGRPGDMMNLSSDSTTSVPTSNTLLSHSSLKDLLRSIKSINFPALGNPNRPQTFEMPPGQLRDTLLPTMVRNAQRRPEYNGIPITKLEDGLREALSDQICESLTQKMKTVHGEIQARRRAVPSQNTLAPSFSRQRPLQLTTAAMAANLSPKATMPTPAVSAKNVPEPPRAPRAMQASCARLSQHESMKSTSSLSGSSSTYLTSDSRGRSRWPTSHRPASTPVAAHEIVEERSAPLDRPAEDPISKGIPIPLDPQFFAGAHTRSIKEESHSPSKQRSAVAPRVNRSRSTRRRSLSISSRHSPSRSSRSIRRHSPPPSSKRRLSDSSHPRFRDDGHSQARISYSPLAKRRRHSFSRPRSPAPSNSDSFRSRRRGSPVSRAVYSPSSHRRRSRSPINQRASFHERKNSFKHRSPEPSPIRRNTPIHMRSIDRTGPSPPSQKDSVFDRLSLSSHRIPRSPEPLPSERHLPRRSHSSSPRNSLSNSFTYTHSTRHSRSPLPAKYRRYKLAFSPPRTSLSPTQVSFRHRLSCPPDENHSGLLGLTTLSSSRDSVNTRESLVVNYDKTQPPTPTKVLTVKREPDIEDFTAALHPSSAVPPSLSPALPIPPASQPSVSHRRDSVSPSDKSWGDGSASVSTGFVEPPHIPQSQIVAITSHDPVRSPSPSPPPPPLSLSQSLPMVPLPSQPSPACPSPAHSSPAHSSPAPLSYALPAQHNSQDSPMTTATSSCHNIPGLWFIKVGHNQADILDYEFKVDAEIAQKWRIAGSSTDELDANSERLSFRLLCLSTKLLQNVYQIDTTGSGIVEAGAAANLLTSATTTWPEQGSLLVQMNPSRSDSRSWLPEDMGPTSPGLDITDFVREGTNVLRLIQLADMTDKIFLLQAVLLPRQQNLPTYWDVAAHDLSDPLSAWDSSPATVEVM